MKDSKILDLTEKKWKVIYEKLFGGFEDIDDEDSDEEEEDEDEDIPKTKEGYAKDGFVVEDVEEVDDDDDEDELDDDDELDDEDELDDKEEEDEKPKSRKQPKRKVKSEVKQNIFAKLEKDDEYLNCESELEEEDYD